MANELHLLSYVELRIQLVSLLSLSARVVVTAVILTQFSFLIVGQHALAQAGDKAETPGTETTKASGFIREVTVDPRKPALGREAAIKEAKEILYSPSDTNNVIFYGEAGVGKTNISETLAAELRNDGMRTFFVELGGITTPDAINKFVTELNELVESAEKEGFRPAIFVDEVHLIMAERGGIGTSVADSLKKALEKSFVSFVSMTTTEEYDRIKKEATIDRRFEPIELEQHSPEVLRLIAKSLVNRILVGEEQRLIETKGSDYLLPDLPPDLIEYVISSSGQYLSSKPRVPTIERILYKVINEYIQMANFGETEIVAEFQPILNSRVEELALQRQETERIRRNPGILMERRIQAEQTLRSLEIEVKFIETLIPVLRGVPGLQREDLPKVEELVRKQIESEQLQAELDSMINDIQSAGDLKTKLENINNEIAVLADEVRRIVSISEISVEISNRDVAEVVSRMSGIQVDIIFGSAFKKLEKAREILSTEHVGNLAVKEKILIALEGIFTGVSRDPSQNKPLGSYLLDGSTGVGKTLLGELLGKSLGMKLEVINMSEFKNPGDVWKLLGSSLGYVGSDRGGAITRPVRQNPSLVIVLDEIEKADLSVIEAMYSILDKGVTKDGEGREVDFRNVLFVLTTNASEEYLAKFGNPKAILEKRVLEKAGHSPEEIEKIMKNPAETREKVLFHLRTGHGLPAAFLARTKTFEIEPLTKADAMKLLKIKAEKIKKHLKNNLSVDVTFSESFIEGIAELHTSTERGGRGLENAIQEYVDTVVSGAILAVGELNGDDSKSHKSQIYIDYDWPRENEDPKAKVKFLDNQGNKGLSADGVNSVTSLIGGWLGRFNPNAAPLPAAVDGVVQREFNFVLESSEKSMSLSHVILETVRAARGGGLGRR